MPKNEGKHLKLATYKVTSAPIDDPEVEKMDRLDQKEFNDARLQMYQGEINDDLINRIKILMNKYPQVNKLYNYLK